MILEKKSLLTFDELRNTIYKHEIFRKDLFIGMTLSYPVIRKESFGNVVSFFLYPNMPSINDSKELVSRPTYWLSINELNGKILFFSDCRIIDFIDTNAYPFQQQVQGLEGNLTIKELREKQKLLGDNFDEIRTFIFKDKKDLTSEEKNILSKYVEILKEISPKGLLPFYRALGNEYCNWLEL